MLPLAQSPKHPGEIVETLLSHQTVRTTQEEVAEALRISRRRLNELIRGRRGVTPDTALRLARYFGTSAEFWLHAQVAWDLHEARRSRETLREIARIPPRGRGLPAVEAAAAPRAAAPPPASGDHLPELPELRRLQVAQLKARAREYEFLLEFLERRGLVAQALRHARIRVQMDAIGIEAGPS